MSNFYLPGETIFFYTQFIDAQDNILQVIDSKVRVLHNSNGNIYEDLPWEDMQIMSPGEYFYNYQLPMDSDMGQYQIIYSGDLNGNIIYNFEFFNIIPNSTQFENVIKVFGYVDNLKLKLPIIDASVVVQDLNDNIVFNSLTDFDGKWEVYLYPGEYKFIFSKNGYNDEEVNVQIGDENVEIEFNNVSLDLFSYSNKGNGMYSIKETYTMKNGAPLPNLNIKIYSSLNPSQVIAEDITDENGDWNCFLNPGNYLLKVNGMAFENTYNKIFRIKVFENGKFKFEDIKKNAIIQNTTNNGTGSVSISDQVLDKDNNPIVDVQINAFLSSDLNNIIAQDYTDLQGNWTLKLNPGNYTIEYYHPMFTVFTENKIIL